MKTTSIAKTEMVVEDYDTNVTFISQGNGVITMEILSESFASIELNCRTDLHDMVSTINQARYNTMSGFYTVRTSTGFVTVGRVEDKVEVKIFRGKDIASAKFSLIEAETLVATLRSCF